MSVDVAMSFGGVHRAEVDVRRTVRLVPALAAGHLRLCDVGARPSARSLLLRVRLAKGPTTAAAIQRLAFWSARAHGMALALGADPGAAGFFAAALEGSDLLERGVPPEALPAALDRAMSALWPAPPRVEVGALPILAISVAGGWRDGLRYDARSRVLAVETPLAPPVGDRLVVSLACAAARAEVRGGARVVEVRPASAPDRRVRYVISLAVEPPLCRVLAAIATPPRTRGRDSALRRVRYVHAGATGRAATGAARLRSASGAGAWRLSGRARGGPPAGGTGGLG